MNEIQTKLNKSTTLTMRINQKYKDMLVKAAKLEHRSITNMIEILIINYWEK